MDAATANEGTGTPHFHNFDAIRLIAALCVVFSHSFLIADGDDHAEPLTRLLGDGNTAGVYGVFVFFIVSGFLVTGSMHASGSVRHFLWKRILRLYPALIVCALLSATVIAPIFLRDRSLLDYLLGLGWLDYAFWTGLLPATRASIPGVQFYTYANGYPATLLNGSLWTIGYEIACYLVIALLASLRLLRFPIVAALLAAIAIAGSMHLSYPHRFFGNFLFLAPGFFAGACLYYLHRTYGFHRVIAGACVALFVVAAFLGVARDMFPLLAAYPLLVLAASYRIQLPSLKAVGDLSYGVYLYGWPVQYAVRGLAGEGINAFQLFLISAGIALIVAWLSWHLIERPALSLKDVWTARPARRTTAANGLENKT